MMSRRSGGRAVRRSGIANVSSTLLGAAFLAASSCRPPARPAAGPSRDSAGIVIIESAAPVWSSGHGRIVVESPTIDLGGGSDPHTAFESITNVLRLVDGRIV